MDEMKDMFQGGRQQMLAAFGELTTQALRAGVDEDVIHALSARFFDGNVAVKKAFWMVTVLPEVISN